MAGAPASVEREIKRLNESLGIPGIAQVVSGNGGLPKVRVASASAAAEIYLHGAQLTSWRPAGAEEILFLSERSAWEDGRAIRGGIPVCFPWFRGKPDDPKAPAHGFARTRTWRLESIVHEGAAVAVNLSMESDDRTITWWPYDFLLEHRITVGAELKLELTVTNHGPTAFRFEEALHTYHRVGEVENVRISGLGGVTFLDNYDENREQVQQGDIRFTGETDNAYVNTQHDLDLLDPELGRRISIAKRNSLTTVVWNPWQEGAATLADLGSAEWRRFACAEASNIREFAVRLGPGERHIMTANMRVASWG